MGRKQHLLVGLSFGCVTFVLVSVLTYRHLKVATGPDADVTDLLRNIEATTGLKIRGINVLGDPKSESVISRLIDYIDEEDWTGRTESWNAAMEALARIGSPAIPKLMEAIQDAPNKAASKRFADGTKLSDFGIQAETTKIQTRAAMVLGRIGDARALPVLEVLPSDNSFMSFYVREAIKRIEKSNDRAPRTSVDQASSDDEVYEVYSAAINELFLDKMAGPRRKVSLVVIKHHTTRYFEGTDEQADPAKRIALWAKSGITVDPGTIDDFKHKNEQSIALEPRFSLPVKQSLISERQLDHYFGEHRRGQWREFDKRHPNSFGFVRLSRVGFNPEHNRALLYADLSCGNLCGEGYYVLVAKNGPAWSVVHTDGLWVS